MGAKIRALLAGVAVMAAPPGVSAASQVGERARLYFREAFLPHLWQGTKSTFTEPGSLLALAAVGVLTAAAHQYEGEVRDYWDEHNLKYNLDNLGNEWGDTYPTVLISAGLLAGGWHFGDERAAAAGEVLAEAALISGAVTTLLKYTTQKERPDESDRLSFPSGHATVAFCTAAVLHDRLGWEVGIPAYLLAVLTGLARMDVEAHWFSDVVMGAGIGIITGYAVSRHHDDYPYGERVNAGRLLIAPLSGPEQIGILAAWSF